jgi:hypothetical protein
MPTSALKIEGLRRVGFKVLRNEPGDELVLGLIGRFWTLRGDLVDFDPEFFRSFNETGYAKATWSFRVIRTGAGTTLTTSTRVQCLDQTSKRNFMRYWRVVGPFSGVIRREALRLVKRECELVQST